MKSGAIRPSLSNVTPCQPELRKNIIFDLEDVEVLPTPNNISHTLGELDPCEKEKDMRGGPVEELESIKLDNQHPEHAVQIGSKLLGSLQD